MVAAGIALIIALNIIVLVRKQAPEMNHTQAAAKSFIMEYFAEIEDN
jgi:hypothetical protein